MTLVLNGISKRYGGLKAVDDVSFVADAARVTALIGPNGAGKTTLLNLISGVVPPDSGQAALAGKSMAGLSPAAIAQCGLARTFQSPQLFEGMTVLETVMVGAHRFGRLGLGRLLARIGGVSRQERDLESRAEIALRYVGLPAALYRRTALDLPYGLQRQVEIARALAMRARAVLLDEPAAGLNNRETGELSVWPSISMCIHDSTNWFEVASSASVSA